MKLMKKSGRRGTEVINDLLCSKVPSPTGELLPDMKDLPFYEVVVEKQDDGAYLVTGNMKHFPGRPFIVTAKEFLDILSKAK
ncbi:MAG: hypothetical protein Q4F28_04260 [Eubacteriales bacterium]|nr:hypothetical protein [Eubacteriales bacterium]